MGLVFSKVELVTETGITGLFSFEEEKELAYEDPIVLTSSEHVLGYSKRQKCFYTLIASSITK